MPPYIPGPPSNAGNAEQNRAIWREFQKIRDELQAAAAYFSATESQPIPIGTTPVWGVLTPVAVWDYPGGSWDEPNGIWTCRVPGYYSLSASVAIAGFGTGNQDYYVGVRLTVTLPGGAPQTTEQYASGQDNLPITASIGFDTLLAQGATVVAEGAAVHQNQTGTVSGAVYLNYVKQA